MLHPQNALLTSSVLSTYYALVSLPLLKKKKKGSEKINRGVVDTYILDRGPLNYTLNEACRGRIHCRSLIQLVQLPVLHGALC